jgi:hypothetical protein
MMSLAHHRRQAHLALAAAVSLALLGAGVLDAFPPDRFGFYPRCPVFAATGLLCPGCGATRALAALLHGHLAEAIRWNGLVVMLLPLFAAWAIAAYRRALAGRQPVWPQAPEAGVAALLVLACGFAVLRNIS